MIEKPILFSGEMVKAILDGRKTQTRRIVSLLPHWVGDLTHDDLERGGFWNAWTGTEHQWQYGDERLRQNYQVGGRLWVRETWRVFGGRQYEYQQHQPSVLYRADFDLFDEKGAWRPSIFMPRWASRITLEITGVRVERLQEISEDDALAEGVKPLLPVADVRYRPAFQNLWGKINGKRAPWASDPWVWVVEFKRVNS